MRFDIWDSKTGSGSGRGDDAAKRQACARAYLEGSAVLETLLVVHAEALVERVGLVVIAVTSRSLARVAGVWEGGAGMAVGANGGKLLPRVRRILGKAEPRRPVRAAGMAMAVLAGVMVLPVVMGMGGPVMAQTEPAGAASTKPANGWPGLEPSVYDGFDTPLGELAHMPAEELAKVKKAVKDQLQTIRGQFELYKIQHADKWPSFELLENNWSVMTTRTDQAGSLTPAGKFGPYMRYAPLNPLMKLTGVSRPGEAWSHVGWTYEEKSGKVTLVVPPGFDTSGMPAEDVTMFSAERDARYKDSERKIADAHWRLSGLQNTLAIYWLKRGRVFPTFAELEKELPGVKEGEAGPSPGKPIHR